MEVVGESIESLLEIILAVRYPQEENGGDHHPHGGPTHAKLAIEDHLKIADPLHLFS